MIRLAKSWRRRFLFRSYLFLAASLLAVAALLDAGFAHLQSRLAPAEDRWLAASFELIESELAGVPPVEREIVATRVGAAIGIPVQVLEAGDVAVMASPERDIVSLTAPSGAVSWWRRSPSADFAILLGPVTPARGGLLPGLLPPLFYLSIFVVTGLWLRPILRDVDLITRATRQFSADYRTPTATAGQTSELTSLARDLDTMSVQLSSLVQSQKELTAALSHEMRTPLARIRFGLAVLHKGSEEERQSQLEAIGADLSEIDGLIASILEYARLDHPDQRMNRQQTPVEPWIRRTLESCREPASRIGISVEPPCEYAWMDARLMGMALSNLVVNACRHARSTVQLSVAVHDGSYRLVVEDDGAGVPEDKREEVFRAFSRLDESRNRDTGGFGLGLAIVKRIAALHGGAVSVDASHDLGGARFTVVWPQAW